MKIEALQERIEKLKTRIEKKHNTIVKKQKLIDRKQNEVDMLLENEYENRWILVDDIKWLEDDIRRLKREITEMGITLEKYFGQLAGEIEKEDLFVKEVPELLKKMEQELIDIWDAWDKQKRERLTKINNELGYSEFVKRFSCADYDFIYTSDEQIHNSNVRDARNLVLDLYNRVKAITGEVTDWNGIEATQGSCGFAVLNGTVIGKEGRAKVESILAGGYNIQRLHVRVIVHEI